MIEGREYVGPVLARALAAVQYPLGFLDFETFAPAVPRLAGTGVYQALPVQWSLHLLDRDGGLQHREFLHRQDTDPREAFAAALLDAVGDAGSLCVYSGYESRLLGELAEALPHLKNEIEATRARLYDLLAVVHDSFYHPGFGGSFSIKAVLPVLVPSLTYEGLEVGDGQEASAAYGRLIGPGTAEARDAIAAALLAYCALDTRAMVRVAHHHEGDGEDLGELREAPPSAGVHLFTHEPWRSWSSSAHAPAQLTRHGAGGSTCGSSTTWTAGCRCC